MHETRIWRLSEEKKKDGDFNRIRLCLVPSKEVKIEEHNGKSFFTYKGISAFLTMKQRKYIEDNNTTSLVFSGKLTTEDEIETSPTTFCFFVQNVHKTGNNESKAKVELKGRVVKIKEKKDISILRVSVNKYEISCTILKSFLRSQKVRVNDRVYIKAIPTLRDFFDSDGEVYENLYIDFKIEEIRKL